MQRRKILARAHVEVGLCVSERGYLVKRELKAHLGHEPEPARDVVSSIHIRGSAMNVRLVMSGRLMREFGLRLSDLDRLSSAAGSGRIGEKLNLAGIFEHDEGRDSRVDLWSLAIRVTDERCAGGTHAAAYGQDAVVLRRVNIL